MTATLEDLAAAEALFVSATAPLASEDGLPDRFRSILLLSPDEPRFWLHFRTSPEAQDGAPDPLDRWSRRVIGRIACTLGTKAYFPFAGPPYRPFVAWALRSGRCHTSPVHLLVHDRAGLFISFRGAIAREQPLPPDPRPRPCDMCAARPCETACPPAALTPAGYDIPACHAFLDQLHLCQNTPGVRGQHPRDVSPTNDCRTGCLVRRACPVGQDRRGPDQSAHHMRHFHP